MTAVPTLRLTAPQADAFGLYVTAADACLDEDEPRFPGTVSDDGRTLTVDRSDLRDASFYVVEAANSADDSRDAAWRDCLLRVARKLWLL